MIRRHALVAASCFIITGLFQACSKTSENNTLLRIEGQEQQAKLGQQVRMFVDLNGDGIPEIVSASVSRFPLTGIGVYSGADGTEIYRITSELNNYIVKRFTFTRDLNGDGIPEIAAPGTGSSPTLAVFSGQDGKLLFKTGERLYFDKAQEPRVISLPDRNGDGIPEIAVDQLRRNLVIFSGKDGVKIHELDPPKALYDHIQYDMASDIDGDGFEDLVGLSYIDRVPQCSFYSSGCLSKLSGPSPLPLPQRPHHYALADLNGDDFPDIVAAHHAGGKPDGSVLLACNGKSGNELWRVNGTNIEGGSQMVVVDADTGETTSTYQDVNFADSLVLLQDLNKDAIPEVATGHAGLSNPQEKTAGCILIFSGKDGELIRRISSPDTRHRIGNAMDSFIDADFNGVADLLLGIPGADAGERKEAGCVILMPL